MRHLAIVAAVGLLCLAPLAVASDSAPPEKTGLKVGENAPAFELADQNGKQRTLDDLAKGADYVAIVFYRSASW
jgi:cytochrome oxidase Cu insertion factor (SCO1/SenC/PrrC family)